MRAMNLLPVEERGGARAPGTPGRASSLTAVHGIAGAGVIVTVGLVGFWALAKHDTASARDAEAAAVARSAATQQQVTRLAPVVAFDARRQARETAVLTLASGRTDWAQVLRATAGSLPANVSLTTLKLAGADAAATAAAAAGTAGSSGLAATYGTVTLQVCADTQPRVATTLRRFRALPQVDDVALSQTARTASSGGGATGGASCGGINADAALSLSSQTVIDGVPAATAATAADTAAAPAGTTTTSSTPTTTNGTGR